MIVQNAAAKVRSWVEKVRASKDDAFGYNALTALRDLVQAGVIDPTKG
jgi:chaperonin GroEL (HSP60 family)